MEPTTTLTKRQALRATYGLDKPVAPLATQATQADVDRLAWRRQMNAAIEANIKADLDNTRGHAYTIDFTTWKRAVDRHISDKLGYLPDLSYGNYFATFDRGLEPTAAAKVVLAASKGGHNP